MDDAGFGLGELRIVVRGRYAEEGGKPAFKVTDSGQLFLLADGQPLQQLKAKAGEVTITAKVDLEAKGSLSRITVEKVE